MTPATSPLPSPPYHTVPVIVPGTVSAPKFWIGDFYLSAGGGSITAVGHSERRGAARRGASETFPASHFHNAHAR